MAGPLARALGALTYKADTLRILVSTGIVRPIRPDRLLKVGWSVLQWGTTFPGGTAAAAARWPDRTAVVDDAGSLTWLELHRQSNALARALSDAGLAPGQPIAVMCRNHRWMVTVTVAAAKAGLTTIYLNTRFAGPQLADVCAREQVAAIAHDADLGEVLTQVDGPRRFVAGPDDAPGDREGSTPRLADLVATGDPRDLPAPPEPGRIVILTSGTTGRPKGAQRHQPSSVDPVASLFDRIPFRAGETTLLAAPLFHSWGMLNFGFGLALGSKSVLQRDFDPERVLAAIEQHRCEALVVVPVMLQRIMQLPREVLERYDVSSLRIIAASGSTLPGDLALAVLDHFGDVLYNFYGSTEVSWVTIAGPADLRAAPGTAGRPPRGTTVTILDEDGQVAPAGQTGEICVDNEMLFVGYTDGESRQRQGVGMSTGDLGHLDAEGRLFVDGRADDMIVSGGENVFPGEVEDLLAGHPGVVDVAVVGVPDPEWGQRLRAYVVPAPGAAPLEGALQAFVRERLSGYKVPREITVLDALPRNATGKVVKRDLPG